MVMPAGDSLTVGDGFAPDASDVMPGPDTEAMPTDNDITLFAELDDEDGAASPEPEPFSVESLPLTPEQQAAFRAYMEAELGPQYEARQAEEARRWDEQRRSLEGKVNNFDQRRQMAEAYYLAAGQAIDHLLQEQGADQTTIDAIRYRIDMLAKQKLSADTKKFAQEQARAQQAQQAQAQQAQWSETELTRLTGEMHAYAKSIGFNPSGTKLNESFAFVANAAKAFMENPTPTTQAALDSAKAQHKAWLTEQGNLAQKRKAAKPAADALKRQQARGVQNTARGTGGGAGPMSLPDHIAALQAELAQAGQSLPYKEVYTRAFDRYQRQPR